jgi:cytochrome b
MTDARVRIWDFPVRLIHWSMVLLVAILWRSASVGALDYHRYAGYALLGMLVFRIYWGFAGSSTARFANFIRGPRALVGYLKRLPVRRDAHPPTVVGHNPLGGLSVLAMLGLLSAQILLGLFAVDADGVESGPLSLYLSFDAARRCARLHAALFNVLLAVIVLHIVAVLFYLIYKRENLISSMLHGWHRYPKDALPTVIFAPLARLLAGIALSGLIVWAVTRAFQF